MDAVSSELKRKKTCYQYTVQNPAWSGGTLVHIGILPICEGTISQIEVLNDLQTIAICYLHVTQSANFWK